MCMASPCQTGPTEPVRHRAFYSQGKLAMCHSQQCCPTMPCTAHLHFCGVGHIKRPQNALAVS